MDRSLDSLSSAFLPLACEWIARVTARGVAVMIIQTSRTLEEHQANLVRGTSGVTMSMHLPRYMRWDRNRVALDPREENKSDAMDIAPYEVYRLSGPDKLTWDGTDPAWGVIGEEAERVGLRWGGRWGRPFDPGHGELVVPWNKGYLERERQREWPTFRVA